MLSRFVPGPMVRWFASPYVAGENIEEALRVAGERLRTRGILTTLDLLGEDVERDEQVEQNIEIYRQLISKTAEHFEAGEQRPSVSVKPSAFTTGPQDAVRDPIIKLAEHAALHQVALTIDMEDHRWTDLTLDLSIGLFEQGLDVGTVLQTRLNRTEADLQRIPKGMRIRLVIGIYPEAEEIAIQDKREMKERMISYGRQLVERGVYVEFATHDEIYIERFTKEVALEFPDLCEVQMLLGVPRRRLQADLQSGAWGPKLPVRLYVPFAIGWQNATAYLRRRMDESPSMIWLVLRNFGQRR